MENKQTDGPYIEWRGNNGSKKNQVRFETTTIKKGHTSGLFVLMIITNLHWFSYLPAFSLIKAAKESNSGFLLFVLKALLINGNAFLYSCISAYTFATVSFASILAGRRLYSFIA